LNSLTDLMKNTSEGVNLLIFVVKVSELKKPEIRNQYDLIVNQLTQNRIPVILVVTNCEQNIQSEGIFEEQCHHSRNLNPGRIDLHHPHQHPLLLYYRHGLLEFQIGSTFAKLPH